MVDFTVIDVESICMFMVLVLNNVNIHCFPEIWTLEASRTNLKMDFMFYCLSV